MNGACDQLFPGAGFTQKQHRRIGSCHHFDLLQDLPQSRTLSYNARKTAYGIDFVLCVENRIFFVIIIVGTAPANGKSASRFSTAT
jgi:hypothetical protein